MYSNAEYRKLLIDLADKLPPRTCMRWHMSNGALFDMALPAQSQILKDTFAPEVGFPFKYIDIKRIDLVQDLPVDSLNAGKAEAIAVIDVAQRHERFVLISVGDTFGIEVADA